MAFPELQCPACKMAPVTLSFLRMCRGGLMFLGGLPPACLAWLRCYTCWLLLPRAGFAPTTTFNGESGQSEVTCPRVIAAH